MANCHFSQLVDDLPDNVSLIDWNSTQIRRSFANLIIQLGEIQPDTSCEPLRVWVHVISLAYYELDCSKPLHFNTCQIVYATSPSLEEDPEAEEDEEEEAEEAEDDLLYHLRIHLF
eukprot:TRINITY_DN2178_c0_g1_i2.p1 TRINITY_DN2178_c0_g1~~TRINITY_DN2178_c0_g1_i2.p1  ORF type:complete len:116 (-),score=26.41 TRINITY_DN2178_c0_g1_i2:18-365(-)